MGETAGMGLRRRDEEGDFHAQVATTCDGCGCTYYRAADDEAIVWEPGNAWEEACRDRACHCHADPVVGARRA